MKTCFCIKNLHSKKIWECTRDPICDFIFKKGKFYEYKEEYQTSIWVIYNENGPFDQRGYRFKKYGDDSEKNCLTNTLLPTLKK